MNGQNSNTSGAEVANIGYWPKGIFPKIVILMGNLLKSLKGLQTGELIPAGVDFSEQGASDKVPDSIMSEITRRLVVTFEKAEPGNVVFSPLPPEDHAKAWWQTDPITGLPISGRLKVWSEESQTWIPVDTTAVYVPPMRRNGRMVAPAGSSTQNINFEDLKTDDYIVTLTPTTYSQGTDSWGPAPATFPAGFGFIISNKTGTSVSVSFVGIPVGGITWEVDIEERKATA